MKTISRTALIVSAIVAFSFLVAKIRPTPQLNQASVSTKKDPESGKATSDFAKSEPSKAPTANTQSPDPSANKLSTKLKFNFARLSRINSEFRNLNPGVDFDHLASDDPILPKLKLPASTPLEVIRDPNCASARDSLVLGKLTEPPHSEKESDLHAPSFSSFTTTAEQTLGELGRSVGGDDCILGVMPNGPIASILLDETAADYRDFLDPSTPGAPMLKPSAAIESDGRAMVEASLAVGNSGQLKIFDVGYTTTANPDEALLPVQQSSGPIYPHSTFYNMPMYSNGQSDTNQITELNKSITLAVANGAQIIILPPVDPTVILAATQYASANGVKVYMRPNSTTAPASSNEEAR
jgi:hypothetical protein